MSGGTGDGCCSPPLLPLSLDYVPRAMILIYYAELSVVFIIVSFSSLSSSFSSLIIYV